ncbi:hypothetical protein MJD09_02320 [bacterium]|nr:hypothetical protein [bacterium]
MLKNITLSAESSLIQKAREKATRESTTLNAVFRQWLLRYVNSDKKTTDFDALMQSLEYARAAKIFGRDDMNER